MAPEFLGVTVGAFVAIWFMVWAGDASRLELKETGEAGCPISVEFKNARVHQDQDITETFERAGVSMRIRLLLGRGETPDEITIFPEPGMVAIPEHLVVDEDATEAALVCYAMF